MAHARSAAINTVPDRALKKVENKICDHHDEQVEDAILPDTACAWRQTRRAPERSHIAAGYASS